MTAITDAMLDAMADVIRVNRTASSDDEMSDLIRAAVLDLSRQGVKVLGLDDPLIWQAVKLYVKANYGYDKDTARFDDAYVTLSAGIALCDDYTKAVVTNDD